MHVEDIKVFLEEIRQAIEKDASIIESISRIVPVTVSFLFQSPEQFESLVLQSVQTWLHELEGKSFHVRMHRRGFKGRLSSVKEEQFLDHFILENTLADGHPARISFENPDIIVAVETVGQRAGLSVWKIEDIERYPFLKLD
jgi:tRNA(Ser,Leu) C12 N-acetylase TAN1